MNAVAALFGGFLSTESFEPVFDGKSAFSLALEKAAALPGVSKIRILVSSGTKLPFELSAFSEKAALVERETWDNAALLEALSKESAGFDFCYYFWADSPFINGKLSDALRRRHVDYPADYTYADGYVYGLSPEILSPAAAAILSKLLLGDEKLAKTRVSRDSVFLSLQKDINSFEIETEVSEIDHRPWRLSLTADSKRNLLLCRRFFDEGITKADDILSFCDRLIKEKPLLLRTLPAYYQIQIVNDCTLTPSCGICPYQKMKPAQKIEMPLENWIKLLDKIESFSGDAVISISLWGEAALHSKRKEFIAEILRRPSLSLIIETGIPNWDEAETAFYSEQARAAPPRLNKLLTSNSPLFWIISAESPSANNPAPETVFQKYFPSSCYVQMVRKRGNEDDVEKFFRYWKSRGVNVIIQKYDNFAGALPDLATADLSPVKRHPCWHIQRDFTVLLDGGVTLCREDLSVLTNGEGCAADRTLIGNAFSCNFSEIWDKAGEVYASHRAGKYPEICLKCDEWYTYNF